MRKLAAQSKIACAGLNLRKNDAQILTFAQIWTIENSFWTDFCVSHVYRLPVSNFSVIITAKVFYTLSFPPIPLFFLIWELKRLVSGIHINYMFNV